MTDPGKPDRIVLRRIARGEQALLAGSVDESLFAVMKQVQKHSDPVSHVLD